MLKLKPLLAVRCCGDVIFLSKTDAAVVWPLLKAWVEQG